MPVPEELLAAVRTRLADRELHRAVALSVDRHSEAYRRALPEPLRRSYALRARAARIEGVRRLPELARLFIARAEAKGVRVHTAGSAAEAAEMVAAIAREHGVRHIVKSKSMATEEIGLNRRLAQDGIGVVETDLGEYIVQLAGEPPSHILAPCLHKSRRQIAELFAREAGRPMPTDTQALTGFARERLRREFRRADMGITGANFLVAAGGAVVVVSNEGNARMCATLPRVHVAVAGVEKLIADFQDLADVLRILPVAATGQAITSYVSVLRGPAGPGEEGPQEMHVVLVDEGRSRILGGPQEEVLACIRCGACLDICPVYREIGGHAYLSVYPGPIGAVLTPLLRDDPKARALPFLSSLCGACADVCPVGIHLHEHLVALRAKAVAGGVAFPGEGFAFRQYRRALAAPARYRLLLPLGRLALRTRAGVRPLAEFRRGRRLPPVGRGSLGRLLRAEGLIAGDGR